MLSNGSGKPIQHVISLWLSEQKLIRQYFFVKSEEAVRGAKRAVATILLLKTYQQWFLCNHLSLSFKIFINMFAFLYAEANSKQICE